MAKEMVSSKTPKSSNGKSTKGKPRASPSSSSSQVASSSKSTLAISSSQQHQDEDSVSESDFNGSDSDQAERIAALAQLQKNFLESFSLPTTTPKSQSKLEKSQLKKNKKRKIESIEQDKSLSGKSKKGKDKGKVRQLEMEQSQQDLELENLLAETEKGIKESEDEDGLEDDGSDLDQNDESGFHSDVSDEEGGSGGATSSKPMSSSTAASNPVKKAKRIPEMIIFDGSKPSRKERGEDGLGKQKWKNFMSSKVSNVSRDGSASSTSNGKSKAPLTDSEISEEKQLTSNDKELSRLLSTTLFAPGSSNSSTSKNGKQDLSSNDTLARLMELTSTTLARKGQAIGRGWGENALKRKSQGQMPDSMRSGLRKKAALIEGKEVDRAKELGIWHPSLKKNFSSGVTGKEEKGEMGRRRERGIGSGVGKFKDGALRIGEDEIKRINSSGRGGRGRGGSSRGRGSSSRGGGRGGSKR